MDVKNLLEKLNGLDSDAQAKVIAKYVQQKNSKKNIETARRATRAKCFKGLKKLTKEQQIAYLYEFIEANNEYINRWFGQHKQELNMNK